MNPESTVYGYSVQLSNGRYVVWFRHRGYHLVAARYWVESEADDHARIMNRWYSNLTNEQRERIWRGQPSSV